MERGPAGWWAAEATPRLIASAVGRGADDLEEPAEFFRVGLVPDLVEVWVLMELPVLKSLPGGFVKDRKGPFL